MKATGIVRRIDAGVIKTPRYIYSKSGVNSLRFIFYSILFVLVRAALTDFKCLCISSNSFRVEMPSFP